jgi:hypothetical protein
MGFPEIEATLFAGTHWIPKAKAPGLPWINATREPVLGR